jgi:hypothetical protein
VSVHPKHPAPTSGGRTDPGCQWTRSQWAGLIRDSLRGGQVQELEIGQSNAIVSGGNCRIIASGGARVMFSFTGRAIDCVRATGPAHRQAQVTVVYQAHQPVADLRVLNPLYLGLPPPPRHQENQLHGTGVVMDVFLVHLWRDGERSELCAARPGTKGGGTATFALVGDRFAMPGARNWGLCITGMKGAKSGPTWFRKPQVVGSSPTSGSTSVTALLARKPDSRGD